MIRPLGASLGATVGASRAAVDAGTPTTASRSARPARRSSPTSTSRSASPARSSTSRGCGLEGDRRDQQGPRCADLQVADLRHRRRPVQIGPSSRKSSRRRSPDLHPTCTRPAPDLLGGRGSARLLKCRGRSTSSFPQTHHAAAHRAHGGAGGAAGGPVSGSGRPSRWWSGGRAGGTFGRGPAGRGPRPAQSADGRPSVAPGAGPGRHVGTDDRGDGDRRGPVPAPRLAEPGEEAHPARPGAAPGRSGVPGARQSGAGAGDRVGRGAGRERLDRQSRADGGALHGPRRVPARAHPAGAGPATPTRPPASGRPAVGARRGLRDHRLAPGADPRFAPEAGPEEDDDSDGSEEPEHTESARAEDLRGSEAETPFPQLFRRMEAEAEGGTPRPTARSR